MNEQNSSLAWFIVSIPIIIVIAFPLFWLFVIWLISLISGWQGLAQRYRASQPATGQKWFNQSGLVNSARYSNALNLTTTDEGVFIEPTPLFRLNHPPLFIPWRDLHNPQPLHRRYRDYVRVDVGHPTIAIISLPPVVFEQGEGRKVLAKR